MFNQISWSSYLQFLILSLALYYTFVLYKYYRYDLLHFLKGKKLTENSRFDPSSAFTSHPNEVHAGEKEKEIPMPQIHELVQQLKNFVQDVTERSFVKEEVIMGFQIILRDYKNLIGTSFQKSINDFIAVECEDKCSIHLDPYEINSVWLG
jgi:hypothetical protein